MADIEPREGSLLHGALYRVRSADQRSLDTHEGVRQGLYRRENIRLADTGETAFVYRMNDEGEYPPGLLYLRLIERGYIEWALPLLRLTEAVSSAVASAQASRSALSQQIPALAGRDFKRV